MGRQDQKCVGGAKDMDFKEEPIFFSNFGLFFRKSGGAVRPGGSCPPPCPPVSNTPDNNGLHDIDVMAIRSESIFLRD